MKHLFIINPAAGGNKKDYTKLRGDIDALMAEVGGEYEIYVTKAPMDACSYIRARAESGEELRIYACGGDGTLNECVNGAAGLENVAVTHYPCGTGNDFIKLFGSEKDRFSDLGELVRGETRKFDLIKCGDRFGINICSVGFDADVAADVHKYSRLPIIGGAAGYVISLLTHLLRGINRRLTVTVDGRRLEGKFTLICACNGRYYGGGFMPIGDAMPDDGVMDSLIVGKTTVFSFVVMIGRYAKGMYNKCGRLIERVSSGRLCIESDEPVAVNIDGEIIRRRSTAFEMVSGAVNFLLPRGMRFFSSGGIKNAAN